MNTASYLAALPCARVVTDANVASSQDPCCLPRIERSPPSQLAAVALESLRLRGAPLPCAAPTSAQTKHRPLRQGYEPAPNMRRPPSSTVMVSKNTCVVSCFVSATYFVFIRRNSAHASPHVGFVYCCSEVRSSLL